MSSAPTGEAVITRPAFTIPPLSEFYVNGNGSTPEQAAQPTTTHPIGPTTPDSGEQVETGSAGEADPAAFWRSRMFTVGEFLQRPPKQWIVDKVIGEQDFCLLYGESGHGKTHVALDLAYSCATGRTFAGEFAVARPLSVVYATGEGIGGLVDRLSSVAAYYGTQEVPFRIIADIPQLHSGSFEMTAKAFAAAWSAMQVAGDVPKLDVLILDTLHNATAGADENSAKDASTIQQSLRYLRDELGCAVVLVHHANKTGTSERGSSALRASMDTVIRSKKNGQSYSLSCEKLKDAEAWPALAFGLTRVDGTSSVCVAWEGSARTSTVRGKDNLETRIVLYLRMQIGRQFTTDEIVEAMVPAKSGTVKNSLKNLRNAGAVMSETTRLITKDNRNRAVWVYWMEEQDEVS